MPSLYLVAVTALVVLIALSLAACLRDEREAGAGSAPEVPAAVPQPAPIRALAAVRAPSAVVPFPTRPERRAQGAGDLALLAAQLEDQAAALQAEGQALREEIRQVRQALADVAAGQPVPARLRLARVG